MRVSLEDVEVGDLNNVCVMLISKFARVLREHNGEVLSLRDKHVVAAVSRHAMQADSPELEVLYLKLKVEIKKHLRETHQPKNGLSGLTQYFKSALNFCEHRSD